MDNALTVGSVVLALYSILQLYKLINNFEEKFSIPLNKLTVSIQKLSDNIETIFKENEVQNKRIEIHGQAIDDIKDRVGKLETKVDLYHNHKGE